MAVKNTGIIYKCDSSHTIDQCQHDFFRDQPERKYIQVAPDGNCFFYCVAEYCKLTRKILPGITDLNNPNNHVELRNYCVQQFSEYIQKNELVNTIVDSDFDDRKNEQEREFHSALMAAEYHYNNSGETLLLSAEKPVEKRTFAEIIDELYTDKKWNVYAFDEMMGVIPSLLNINLKIYTLGENNEISVDGQLPINGPASTTISLFLAGGHYGLIYPDGNNNNNMRRFFKKKDPFISEMNNAMAESRAMAESEPLFNENFYREIARSNPHSVAASASNPHSVAASDKKPVHGLSKMIRVIKTKSKNGSPNTYTATIQNSSGGKRTHRKQSKRTHRTRTYQKRRAHQTRKRK